MRQKWALFFLLIISLFFNSCVKKNQEFLKDRNKMVNIIRAIEVLNTKHKMNLISDSLYQIERNSILTSQGITEKEFNRKIKSYLNNLDEFELLLKDVKLELEKTNLN